MLFPRWKYPYWSCVKTHDFFHSEIVLMKNVDEQYLNFVVVKAASSISPFQIINSLINGIK